MQTPFKKAARLQCKASIQIEGLTGSGKSGLALILGHGLANNDWNKVFHIDTENNSANLFVGIPSSVGNTFGEFNVAQLTEEMGYKPSHYLAFREYAINEGAEVVIKDSISHAWQHKGGVLDLVNQVKNSNDRFSRDSYAAWAAPEVVAEKNKLISLLRDKDCHVITTVRVKEKMEYDKNAEGKTVLVSLGEQQIQQAELKYEPDLVIHMLQPGSQNQHPVGRIEKTRYAIFSKGETYEFTPELIKQLKDYLEEGANPEELVRQQAEEYIKGIEDYLKANKRKIPEWNILIDDAGFKGLKVKEIPLSTLKALYVKLIA